VSFTTFSANSRLKLPFYQWDAARSSERRTPLYCPPKNNASEHIQHHLRPLAHPDARNTHKIAPAALRITYIHTVVALPSYPELQLLERPSAAAEIYIFNGCHWTSFAHGRQ